MYRDTAKNFWRARTKYPNYPNLLKRRLLDLNFLIDYVIDAESILDLGCGDGYLLLALREFSSIKRFYGYDLSGTMICKLRDRWGDVHGGLNAAVFDFVENNNYPDTDVIISFGSFPYVFDVKELKNIVSNINSDIFVVRSPCTMRREDEIIDKFSDDLGDNYSAVYRTVDFYVFMLSEYFVVDNVCRAYPDELESKYGTKQFFFVCKRRN